LSLGATFQLGAKFGVGYSGGNPERDLDFRYIGFEPHPHMGRALSLAAAPRQV
jgi:hypothetical protein